MPTDPTPAVGVRHPGGCLQPVLLRGRVDQIDGATGELLHRYTTVHEPGGVLPIACKTRRASRCPPCAEVYRADTYQLIRAGLTGGKGIPATVAQHPCVFTTLTAPSFGPVHAHRERDGKALACHPRRNAEACPHGVHMSCTQKHARDDDQLGEPLCPDCYDYTGSVLFNACAPELWRRFTITLRRTLARQAGLTSKAFTTQARLSYAKVAEYQRRGVVHFHAIIRLDGPNGPATTPPAWATLTLLTDTIAQAARIAGERIDGTTKSGRTRVVSIDDETVAVLRQHKADQAADQLKAGDSWRGVKDGSVFRLGRADLPRHRYLVDDQAHPRPQPARARPTPQGPATARPAARPTAHPRHTLLLSGVPVHVVAARLGHGDPAITLRVYAHVIRTAEAAAADIFAKAVKAA